MKQRIVSGVVLTVFCAAVILFNRSFPLALNIVAALISAIGVFELIKALGLEKKWFLCIPAVATAAAAPFCEGNGQFYLYCQFAVILFAVMIFDHRETTFQEAAVLFSMAVIIPGALKTLVALRDTDPDHGIYSVLVAVLCAWVADIGAYFTGTFLGKHKLCPEISPKKTVEGAIGGMVLDVAVILFSGWCVSQVMYRGSVSVNYLSLFLAGFLGAPISILGDLTFSIIKRSCHIKDFGQVIPGHGGILDRFDSVIFTAPFVYLLTTVLPFFVK